MEDVDEYNSDLKIITNVEKDIIKIGKDVLDMCGILERLGNDENFRDLTLPFWLSSGVSKSISGSSELMLEIISIRERITELKGRFQQEEERNGV